ncbi:hypothetical protein PoB_001713400 [Plakobranchus ocellatus]|uniref:Uncharacterized protein n=1 Tax=Plakobranchus ocellatus TaxID=259542 RepID=A0AAV3Z5P3_9GAST|nr:hypothetical protein PoB_001713400 [Plakobranchus ocellatus]
MKTAGALLLRVRRNHRRPGMTSPCCGYKNKLKKFAAASQRSKSEPCRLYIELYCILSGHILWIYDYNIHVSSKAMLSQQWTHLKDRCLDPYSNNCYYK